MEMPENAKVSKGNDATAEWFHRKITRGCHPDAIEEKWIPFPTGDVHFV